MEELKVNATLNGDTLTVLTGQALEQKHPVPIRKVGNIHTLANFLDKRIGNAPGVGLQEVDPKKAIVTVDEQNLSITLELDPENHFGAEVFSKLEFTPELQQFHINESKQYSREELVKLIRFNRRFFEGDHGALLLAYQKLQVSTAATVNQESDTRGNKASNFIKSVNSESIPTEFILNIPVFKGFDPVRFRVEICLDATDQSVRFWFESLELAELIEVKSKEILDAQLEYCKDFVIITK